MLAVKSTDYRRARKTKQKEVLLPTYYELHKEECQAREREYRKNNREKILARKRKYDHDPANKVDRYEYGKKYRAEHHDEILELKRKWKANNPEKVDKYRTDMRNKWREFSKFRKQQEKKLRRARKA